MGVPPPGIPRAAQDGQQQKRRNHSSHHESATNDSWARLAMIRTPSASDGCTPVAYVLCTLQDSSYQSRDREGAVRWNRFPERRFSARRVGCGGMPIRVQSHLTENVLNRECTGQATPFSRAAPDHVRGLSCVFAPRARPQVSLSWYFLLPSHRSRQPVRL